MGETMSETEPATKAWKGLDKDFSCRGHAFAVGETYSIDGAPIVCERGFHACTSPLDVLAYYPFGSGARYAEVELLGATVAHHSDSKIAASSIRIVREITYADLWAAHRAWLQETLKEDEATGDSGHASATGVGGHASATGVGGHASATGYRGHASATGVGGHASATGYSGHASATGDSGHASATGDSGHASATGYRGHASATGDSGHASATGYRGHASATGDSGHASATGDNGHASATGVGGHASATGVNAISVAIGISARAKASAGNWIVLARYTRDGELVEVKTAKIGEGGLKPDTWYRLDEDGGFVALDGGEETAR